MSLGILKVAAIAKQQGHTPTVLDLSGVRNYMDVIEDVLGNTKPNSVFAITATTPQFPSVVEICNRLRSAGHLSLIHI